MLGIRREGVATKGSTMQKVIIGFLAVTTAVLSVACGVLFARLRAVQQQSLVMEQARAAEVEAREAQAARVQELERNEARLERQVREFAKVTTTLRSNEAAQSSNLVRMAERVRAGTGGATASGEGDGGGLGKGMGEMLGKMMKEPAMREMLREQQKALVNMMYGGLFKELNLSPEEKDKLKALLTDAQMRNVEAAQGLFEGGDTPGVEDSSKQIAAAKKQTDEEIRALLGDERFAQYEEYQKSVGERVQIDQFKTRLAAENKTLRDDQSALLLQIMKDERVAVPPVIPTDQTQTPRREFFTPENIEKQGQWMDDYNRRVTQRVQDANVLTPEQLKEFTAFQEQQTSMQKLGMSMVRQMFGGNKTDAAPAK